MVALSATLKQALVNRFGAMVRFDEPMARHTYFRIGGPADAMVFPETAADVTDLLGMLDAENADWFVCGGGTNLLVRDGGIRGVVISPGPGLAGINSDVEPDCGEKERFLVEAKSGTPLGKLCRFTADRGFSGMVFAAGIPGTVGGAAMMNAGIPSADMSGVIASLDVVCRPGRIRSVDRSEMAFEYRSLVLPPDAAGSPGKPGMIVSATLRLTRGDPERIRNETEKRLLERKQSQPKGFSAGSIFKNPPGDPPAGELIDRVGLKRHAVGGGVISDKHANFIINRDNASAADILALMKIMQNRVYDAFGVTLEPEVKIIGEDVET